MSTKIEQAKLLATFIHHGQKRQDGEDYINHPGRMVASLIYERCSNCTGVMKSSNGNVEYHRASGCWIKCEKEIENIICAIWLHDTIEDSGKASDDVNGLIRNIFGDDIWELVIILTNNRCARYPAGQSESYNDYITRVFQHPIAWKIKWLDMIDNTSYPIPEKQKIKYRDACIHLMAHGVTIPDILKDRLEI